MMHYRYGACAEVFALERIREGAARTSASFCPFCGEDGLAQVSHHSAALYGERHTSLLQEPPR